MSQAYIISAKRTPIGGFNGTLSSLSSVELGIHAMKAVMKNVGLKGDEFDHVFMGNVIPTGLGQAPTKQAALGAGISTKVPCTGVNKVCASGMMAVILGAQMIKLGEANCILSGGMESMTNIPYHIPKARFGHRMGDGAIIDGMLYDGLTDPFEKVSMGLAGEKCAEICKLTRKDIDDYAVQSYERSIKATKEGLFFDEIEPIEVKKNKKAKPQIINVDDEVVRTKDPQALRKLRPAFTKNGLMTAGNSSTISDGAAALVLVSESMLKTLKVKPIARILGYGAGAQEPMLFTTSPAIALRAALKHANLPIDSVDYHEINEAFAVVPLANQKILSIPNDRLNVFGGAVSLGHPIGASGARIIVTLLNILKKKKGKIGAATICNGGGGASSIIIELL
ncbi:acetyl-coa acetyltransferase cytosolic [Anaeramoeba ignava]|uniref:acetyl-CoA C-acetyltransferase n=1 Tax=Anaeramoeba ignava TaxID=1746090 RepID=A0A9Q0L5M0_ANAIG|nr:acetyl-coa acetyltransferase cytosolic [Anaeramoeba ignava]